VSPVSFVGEMSSGVMIDKEIRRESIKKRPKETEEKKRGEAVISHCGPRTERSPRFCLSLIQGC